MNVLIEAFYISSKYITGIERHFTLQLQVLNRIDRIKKIIIITNKYFNLPIGAYTSKEVEIIKIGNNTVSNWARIYQETRINLIYSTFTLPPILPKENIPILYVLHDPGRYLFPELMDDKKLDSNNKFFEKYINNKNFHVVTVSNSSKKDIIKFFPSVAGRVHVIYNFVCDSLLKVAGSIGSQANTLLDNTDYFLTVGRFSPTKNTLNIVKAFEKRGAPLKDFKLIIVGRKGWYYQLNSYLETFSPANIVVLDNIKDDQLIELYQNCYGVVIASLYEGFCMPLIEATYCGCPRVFCSDIAVFQEIDHFGFNFFNQNDVNDIIVKTFASKCGTTIRDGLLHSKHKFTIEESCSQFINMLSGIVPNE